MRRILCLLVILSFGFISNVDAQTKLVSEGIKANKSTLRKINTKRKNLRKLDNRSDIVNTTKNIEAATKPVRAGSIVNNVAKPVVKPASKPIKIGVMQSPKPLPVAEEPYWASKASTGVENVVPPRNIYQQPTRAVNKAVSFENRQQHPNKRDANRRTQKREIKVKREVVEKRERRPQDYRQKQNRAQQQRPQQYQQQQPYYQQGRYAQPPQNHYQMQYQNRGWEPAEKAPRAERMEKAARLDKLEIIY